MPVSLATQSNSPAARFLFWLASLRVSLSPVVVRPVPQCDAGPNSRHRWRYNGSEYGGNPWRNY
jgi:hypothetical protein